MPLLEEPGLRIPNMFDSAIEGSFRALFVQGEDIAQSDPNTAHVFAALGAMELVVVQDLFENETANYQGKIYKNNDAPMNPNDALRLVNLGERQDHFPAQLSGGEQQRVAIARAIAKQPSVLLCDEPTGALDISTGVVVLEALARVNTEMGTTTVVITHNAAIASMADRVIRLADGRVTSVEDRTERKLSPHELSW